MLPSQNGKSTTCLFYAGEWKGNLINVPECAFFCTRASIVNESEINRTFRCLIFIRMFWYFVCKSSSSVCGRFRRIKGKTRTFNKLPSYRLPPRKPFGSPCSNTPGRSPSYRSQGTRKHSLVEGDKQDFFFRGRSFFSSSQPLRMCGKKL